MNPNQINTENNNQGGIDLSAMNLAAMMSGTAGGASLVKTNKNDNFEGFKVYTFDPANPEGEIWLMNVSTARATAASEGTTEATKFILDKLVQIGVIKTYRSDAEETKRNAPKVSDLASAFDVAFGAPAPVATATTPIPETPVAVEPVTTAAVEPVNAEVNTTPVVEETPVVEGKAKTNKTSKN